MRRKLVIYDGMIYWRHPDGSHHCMNQDDIDFINRMDGIESDCALKAAVANIIGEKMAAIRDADAHFKNGDGIPWILCMMNVAGTILKTISQYRPPKAGQAESREYTPEEIKTLEAASKQHLRKWIGGE